MNKKDLKAFSKIWGPASEMYGKEPSDAVVMMAFRLLEKYTLAEISQALVAHMRDPSEGVFAPKPANIIGQIEKINHDGRLSADEAWGLALLSFDENMTVVLNNEIAAALTVARDIYLDGDKTGARMAFRPAYERSVEAARARGEPIKWWPSLGYDLDCRARAIQEAVEKGWLAIETPALLGLPFTPDTPLLGADEPEPEGAIDV